MNIQYYIFIFYSISFPSIETISLDTTLIETPSLTQRFLKDLLTKSYPHCSILFFQDRYDNTETLNYLVRNTEYMNYFNIKYSFPTPQQIKTFVDSVKEFHLPSTSSNLTSVLSSPSTLPLKFPITVSNYHRRSDQCVVSIMMISDIRSQFITQIYNLLTPVYIPITRKDMDYFVLVTRPHLMNRLMLMRELPARIKYKIAVGEVSSSNLIVRTVCFFCGDGGSPEILEYPSQFKTEIDYFPDMVQNLNGKTLHVSCPYIRSRIEADRPWEGVGNARRGLWKNLFEEFLTVRMRQCEILPGL
jgi:hypothetical protein